MAIRVDAFEWGIVAGRSFVPSWKQRIDRVIRGFENIPVFASTMHSANGPLFASGQ
ncbi:hypothetical protein [Novipirellula caenicola]|uniref:hypothetical protein n=1 Tax=Novipirellula caenicola TaxID=1536901 RepID=UPI0031E6735F